jgi:hypothetical protein
MPLAANAANNGLKQLLQTAEVTQKRSRIIISASLSPSLLSDLENDETNSSPPAALPNTPVAH